MPFGKVVLLGYMGSGKSATAQALSQIAGVPYRDLDTEIEIKAQSSISDIFAAKGEIAFRKLEHEFLKEMLASQGDLILALGGGTPCYSGNYLLMETNGVRSIYLQASIATLADRLAREKSQRPILSAVDPEDLPAFIGTHLFERSFYYTKADYTISVDAKTPSEIAAEICQKLK